MTCASCLHSVETADGILWCRHWGRVARARCDAFLYCPGTDEPERIAAERQPPESRNGD
jgi:hypothetical protein